MYLSQIMQQLWNNLPQHTPFFTDNVEVLTLTRSGTTCTVTTQTPHGLVAGAACYVYGAILKYQVSSLTQVDGIATAVVEEADDLTQGWQPTINISGADQAGYNGTFELLTVPDRYTFTYPVDPATPSPATGSDIFLNDNPSINPYNGYHVVTTAPTPTTFTFQIQAGLNPYSPAGGTIIVCTRFRIGGAFSLGKALEFYSAQQTDNYWLFVVLGKNQASKDRATRNDSILQSTPGTQFRQTIITQFAFYVVAKLRDDFGTRNSLSGRATRDQMEQLMVPLFKSLLRCQFQSQFAEIAVNQTVFVSSEYLEYDRAYYIHEYVFENQVELVLEDTVPIAPNVAFRDIYMELLESRTNPNIIAETNVDLDVESG